MKYTSKTEYPQPETAAQYVAEIQANPRVVPVDTWRALHVGLSHVRGQRARNVGALTCLNQYMNKSAAAMADEQIRPTVEPDEHIVLSVSE